MTVLDLLHTEKPKKTGGEIGIRTLGSIAATTVFETAPFDHSGTSPHSLYCGLERAETSLKPLGLQAAQRGLPGAFFIDIYIWVKSPLFVGS